MPCGIVSYNIFFIVSQNFYADAHLGIIRLLLIPLYLTVVSMFSGNDPMIDNRKYHYHVLSAIKLFHFIDCDLIIAALNN